MLHAAILGLGIAAVAIPIAIHLLVKRKKPPMPWGAMRFVQLAVKQTRRRMMLERWLLLACRCLLVLAAGIALARPLWSSGDSRATGGGQVVYVIIDNSLASGTTDAAGVSDLAKNIASAKRMLESLRPGDQAAVITAARPAAGVIMPASGNIASVIEVLDRLEPTSSGADLRGAVALAAGEIERASSAAQSGGGAAGFSVVHLISQWRGTGRMLTEPELSVSGASAGSGGSGSSASTELANRAALVIQPPSSDATLSSTGIAGIRLQRPLVIQPMAEGGAAGSEAGSSGTAAADPTAIVTVDVVRSGAGVSQEQTSEVVLRVVPAIAAANRGATSEGQSANDASTTRVRVNFAAGQRRASAIAAVPIRATGGQARENSGQGTDANAVAGTASGGFVIAATLQASSGGAGPVRDSLASDNALWRGLVMKPAIRIGILADEQAWSPSARQAWRLGTVSNDRVDAFTPGHWLSLALQPSLADQSALRSTSGAIGGLQLIDLEQGPLERSVLAGLDAVMVLSPQVVGGGGSWTALREFVDLGGVAVVMPPAGGSNGAGQAGSDGDQAGWIEGMTSAFALDWAFSGVRQPPQREGEGATQERERWPLVVGTGATTGDSGEASGGANAARDLGVAAEGAGVSASSGDLLAALRGELPELAAAVSFDKLLSPQRRAQAAGQASTGVTETQVYLSSSEGQGVLLAARPKAEGGMLIYLASALDLGWTDLVAKPLMVPLMQELVRQGVGLSVASAGISGSQGQVTASIIAGQRPALRQGLRVLGASVPDEPLTKAGVYPVEDDAGRMRGALTVQAAVHEQLLDIPEAASVLRFGRQLFGEADRAETDASRVVMVADATASRVQEAISEAAGASSGRGSGASTQRDQRASSSIWIGLALLAALVEIGLARASSQPQGTQGAAIGIQPAEGRR